MLKAFEVGELLGSFAFPKTGMTTGDNDRFLRLWCEININKFNQKWFPYCKGGGYRRWYGYNEYLVNWENDGFEIKNNIKDNGLKAASVRSEQLYFKPLITWSAVTSGTLSCRNVDGGALFDSGGSSISVDKNKLFLLALLNGKLAQHFLNISNATINYQPCDIASVPVLFENVELVEDITRANITLSRADWDAFETSWDFARHPLIRGERTVEAAFAKWKREAAERFATLKANEEELNRLFIDIYGLADELTPEVEDKDVTVRRADKGREVRSLISYAVGCLFGRYSPFKDGLIYAGGEWNMEVYKNLLPTPSPLTPNPSPLLPDPDNILPICDDEYFDDDLAGRFADFIKTVYGEDTLEENLKFIAGALGGKGTPREVIRGYFLNGFYADHLKIYQKRPIYWLFDSGKRNGFKGLFYLHRYSRDLLATLRTDYVHEQQERYRTQLAHINAALNAAQGAERAKLLKQQEKLTEQARELAAYEEKVHHLADMNIALDLDDGVKKNYAIFGDVLAKI